MQTNRIEEALVALAAGSLVIVVMTKTARTKAI
jgi:hypothetical protein